MTEPGGGNAVATLNRATRGRWHWRRLALIAGPGLVVTLADTDVGSILTAAQSGAQLGYRLLLLQLLIIPLLFMVQELTIRLGVNTGQGYAELVCRHFGRRWSMLVVGTVIVSCLGALVTEISGLAGVGEMYGIAAWQTSVLAVGLIFVMVLTGSYRSVERVAIALGLFELAFFFVAWRSHPDLSTMLRQSVQLPFGDHGYLYLLAANLGTSIMPWTVFYQQSAIADKGLSREDLPGARLETLLGAVLCQCITAAILVAGASMAGNGAATGTLSSIPQLAAALTPLLGDDAGRIVFALGLGGAALVAIIVVCLTGAWAVGEVAGVHHSLDHGLAAAPWFYGAFALILAAGGALVGSGVNLVRLSIAAGVVNALLLPIVLGVLFYLACTILPEPDRLKGLYAVVLGAVFCVTAAISVYAGILGASP